MLLPESARLPRYVGWPLFRLFVWDVVVTTAYIVVLTAITRTIRIDLEQALGEPNMPAPVKPVDEVLW